MTDPRTGARTEAAGADRESRHEPAPAPRRAPPPVRRFGRVNWLGLYTLTEREVVRFASIWSQTVLAPLVTAALFLLIFDLAIGARRGAVMGVSFVHFLAPGILMMSVIQNAFANTASSIVLSKLQGNIVDTLMPPLSPLELTLGYMFSGMIRGIAVAAVIALATFPLLGLGIAHPLWALVFLVLGSAMMALVGMLTGIASDRFDQMNAITNFIVTPLSFLSGTFYSITVLPPALRAITAWNPVFYLIDGMRHGVTGVSDSSPWKGAAICAALTGVLILWCWEWFRRGYRLKS